MTKKGAAGGSSGSGRGGGWTSGEEIGHPLDKYDLDRFVDHHRSTSSGLMQEHRTVFEEHLGVDEAMALVKSRLAFTGTLHVDPNTLRAYVSVDSQVGGAAEDICIEGWFARNRALNGDRVVVKAIDDERRETAVSMSAAVASTSPSHHGNVRPPARAGCSGGVSSGSAGGVAGQQRLGKIVALIRPNRDLSFVCLRAASAFVSLGQNSDASILMQPLDRTAPKLAVHSWPQHLPARGAGDAANSRRLYLVSWSGWHASSATPSAVVIRELAVLESLSEGLEAILRQHKLSLSHTLTRSGSPHPGLHDQAGQGLAGREDDPGKRTSNVSDMAASHGQIPSVTPTLAQGDAYSGMLSDFPASWSIPWSVRRQRQACTATHVPATARVFTIDSDGALDLDDALSVVRLPNGNLQVGIHISDVSYFVEPGSELNALAAQRAISVYLASGETLPMLPPRLANNLCSLVPNRERLCVSVSFEVTRSGRMVRSLGAARTILRSQCRLTYAQADLLLAHGASAAQTHKMADSAFAQPLEAMAGTGEDGIRAGCGVATVVEQDRSPQWWQSLVDDLKLLAAAAGGMRSSRLSSGAIDFGELPMLKLSVDKNIVELSPYDKLGEHSRQLVSELMLMLNGWVASVLVQHFPGCAPLRVQGAPSVSRLANLVKWCEMHDIDAGMGDSLALQRIVDAAAAPGAPAKFLIAKTKCALAMSPARYACAGRLSDKARRHFSLDLDCFTQFSSPIRRYLDIVVHRMLLDVVLRSGGAAGPAGVGGSGLSGGEGRGGGGGETGSGAASGTLTAPLTAEFMLHVCEVSDKAAARARAVQNMTWDLCLAKHLHRTPRMLVAIITQVSPMFLKIYIPQLPYLSDNLRRIPMRVLGPSSVSCDSNEEQVHLTWGVWVLGSTPAPLSIAEAGKVAADGATREEVRKSVRLFDRVRVQLVGHVDARGIAGPKIEALELGNMQPPFDHLPFVVPFDHRANPLEHAVVRSLPPKLLVGGHRGTAGADAAPVATEVLRSPPAEAAAAAAAEAKVVTELTREMRHVLALHMASAAAALTSEDVVRVNGVRMVVLPLSPGWSAARFSLPLEVLAGLDGARLGCGVVQKQHLMEALCGGAVRPGVLTDMLSCVYVQCPELVSIMDGLAAEELAADRAQDATRCHPVHDGDCADAEQVGADCGDKQAALSHAQTETSEGRSLDFGESNPYPHDSNPPPFAAATTASPSGEDGGVETRELATDGGNISAGLLRVGKVLAVREESCRTSAAGEWLEVDVAIEHASCLEGRVWNGVQIELLPGPHKLAKLQRFLTRLDGAALGRMQSGGGPSGDTTTRITGLRLILHLLLQRGPEEGLTARAREVAGVADDEWGCIVELDDSQRAALNLALSRPLSRIKGAHFTGKTRLVLQIARCFALRNRCLSREGGRQGQSVVLVCVPQGADPALWTLRFEKEAARDTGLESPVSVCTYVDGAVPCGVRTEVVCCCAVDAEEAVQWLRCEGGAGAGDVVVSQVVVDDCCLMWEVECMLPLLMLDGPAPAAVLVGDPMTTTANAFWGPHECLMGAAAGAGWSGDGGGGLLERHTEGVSVWLRCTYGAAAALVEFSSIHLYPFGAGACHTHSIEAPHLEPPACLPGMWPAGPHCGRVLCHINGREERLEWAASGLRHPWPRCAWGNITFTNPSEALKVVEAVSVLCHSGRVRARDVLVVTPWHAQQRLILSMLSGKTASSDGLASDVCASPDDEGILFGEGLGGGGGATLKDVRVVLLQDAALLMAEVVIVSTVRSLPVSKPLATTASSKWVTEQLGAVADARLINVALTRARRALCIIGNVDTLEGSSVGRQLTQYYKDTGCFVSADHWPPR